ncbi:iron uptake transporter permease EfeU [Embleya sp. NPDC020630]|uniref:iron uptake transporter permease EfeU n=1 Tax=Embleya sp. NPDC020630 TaxID=3363979 RepID=UPI0037A647DD
MFANYLIGLREGLEAALVVSILIAYLVKTGRREALPAVWVGIGAAVAMSVALEAALELTSAEMDFKEQEAFGGSLSIFAVALVTWMIFWMRRTSHALKAELQGKLDHALAMGTGALVLTAFLSVGREGLETAVIVWGTARSTGENTEPMIGVALGLASAVVLGYLFYAGAVRINLAKFFLWTGAGLVVVAAGVLAYGVHDLQEADYLPGLSNRAFDISDTIPPDTWYGTLLKGILNFQPDPTVLQVAVWAAYLVPVMALFFLLPKGGPKKAPSAAPRETTAAA